MKSRRELLREAMRKEGLEATLLVSSVSIRYYTGFSGGEGWVLLTQAACCLITDFRYTVQARTQADDGVRVIEHNGHGQQLTALRELLTQNGVRHCGYEDASMTVAAFAELTGLNATIDWTGFSERIAAPRRIKSACEIEALQRAQGMADRAYAELLTRVKPGMTEREVAATLDYLCALQGSAGPSFDTIVASGPNGAMCHATPGQRQLQKGDLVVVDFGCICEGYHSDMTRTFGVSHADDTLKEIYDVVREAQELGLLAVRAGMTGAELDDISRRYIASCGYGAYFGHGLGHGFGLEIHEFPRAGIGSADVLQAGMTVTIEPGIYLEGKGGVRIEDCVVVTETGCMDLVSSAKDLLFI